MLCWSSCQISHHNILVGSVQDGQFQQEQMGTVAHFTGILANVDEEAKELNRKTRPIAFRQHIGDGYYVSVTGGVVCVDIRKHYIHCGLLNDQVHPSKSGLVLRLDKWVQLLLVIPAIHATYCICH